MTHIAGTYAQALYSLAKEENLTDELLAELGVLRQSFAQTPEFVRLLSTPNLPKQERCAILDESFRGSVQPYLLNFLKLLTERGYMRHFDDCCAFYSACYDRDHGILPVRAVTAVPLSDAQAQRLTDKLSTLTGKTVRLEGHVDPSVLGGVQLSYDGTQIDGTVKSRLEALGRTLKNTVIEV